jgi:hypothetical protein
MRRFWGVAALAAAVVVAGAGCLPAPPSGNPPPLTLFPSNALTVPDPAQATGKRVDLPKPADCVANKSECDEITLIDKLDGFDLDPALSVHFAGAIDVAKVNDDSVYVEPTGGGARIGVNRLVWDGSTTTLYAHPKQQLHEATEYRLVVTPAVNGQTGTSTFTTMSATTALTRMRQQIDDGSAYTSAGIADRGLSLDQDSTNQPSAYSAATVVPVVGMTRTEDIGSGKTQTEQVFDSALPAVSNAGTYAFGSFDAPQWLDATSRTIPTPPTAGSGPTAVREERVGFVLVTPTGTPPPGGWPVAIFGPGITRSKYDVFLASDENLKKGIATISIDPVGHAYGPKSSVTISRTIPPGSVTIDSHGRGVDVNGDGTITDEEGVSAKGQPDSTAGIALRDGLRQTALDNVSLVRALQHDYGGGGGFEVPGSGSLSRTNITYYAQSLGGIYGTMAMATDPQLTAGVLNVPGGPIIEIARLSPGFRDQVGTELEHRVPPLYNGPPGGPPEAFQESTPLYVDPPVTNPAPGAIAIQQALARDNWIDRLGSPEAFAPLLQPNGKKVLYQFAFGDQTVPNPTSATLMRAGGLQGVTTYYRNDQTPTKDCNPHGFLIDPRLAGRQLGQMQVATFLASGGTTINDPDGPLPVFETPIADPGQLEHLNFSNPPPQPPPTCG